MNYREIYELLSCTPLKFDCGRLCKRACCVKSDETEGMYLFPGEYEALRDVDDYSFVQKDLKGFGPVWLMNCPGQCDRALRPLACRIFPLSIHADGQEKELRLDPRGRAVCPLCHTHTEALDPEFTEAAEQVMEILLKDELCTAFLKALSAEQDAFESFL